MIILRPADIEQPRKPDQAFAAEAEALQAAGLGSVLFDQLAFEQGEELRLPALHGQTVVYRGWMLPPADYARLLAAIRASGGQPLTSVEQYTAAHYLPQWYPLLSDLTPLTVVLDPTEHPEAVLRELNWPAYFIKDYVKSIKTGRGAIIHAPEELEELLEAMRHFRGTIEGGLCVRAVEPLLESSEQRFFGLSGRAYAADPAAAIPAIVHDVVQRIASPFFSIDWIQRQDGQERIVEIGDGQVSDLVGWTEAQFARIWLAAAL